MDFRDGWIAGLAVSAFISSMKDWIEHFRVAACGMPVSHIWRGYGSALFIELGALTSSMRHDGNPGNAYGEIGVMIEWSWRIEGKHSILCGSWSDNELWEPSFSRLIGQQLLDITTFGRLPEVAFSFSDDLHIASFMTAEGDPQWTLFDRRGATQIAVACRSGTMVEET